eukprot:TRINITY_DN6866_c0_g2_i1.p1 TRINITY_DN6866_c0_g2~~TRINITY_DN6866_c0_g2_i1.p1  ORF type:complete len:2190 (+),score=564.10 TRINITY_DN6866_c0_g2_i1:86-6655(+)
MGCGSSQPADDLEFTVPKKRRRCLCGSCLRSSAPDCAAEAGSAAKAAPPTDDPPKVVAAPNVALPEPWETALSTLAAAVHAEEARQAPIWWTSMRVERAVASLQQRPPAATSNGHSGGNDHVEVPAASTWTSAFEVLRSRPRSEAIARLGDLGVRPWQAIWCQLLADLEDSVVAAGNPRPGLTRRRPGAVLAGETVMGDDGALHGGASLLCRELLPAALATGSSSSSKAAAPPASPPAAVVSTSSSEWVQASRILQQAIASPSVLLGSSLLPGQGAALQGSVRALRRLLRLQEQLTWLAQLVATGLALEDLAEGLAQQVEADLRSALQDLADAGSGATALLSWQLERLTAASGHDAGGDSAGQRLRRLALKGFEFQGVFFRLVTAADDWRAVVAEFRRSQEVGWRSRLFVALEGLGLRLIAVPAGSFCVDGDVKTAAMQGGQGVVERLAASFLDQQHVPQPSDAGAVPRWAAALPNPRRLLRQEAALLRLLDVPREAVLEDTKGDLHANGGPPPALAGADGDASSKQLAAPDQRPSLAVVFGAGLASGQEFTARCCAEPTILAAAGQEALLKSVADKLGCTPGDLKRFESAPSDSRTSSFRRPFEFLGVRCDVWYHAGAAPGGGPAAETPWRWGSNRFAICFASGVLPQDQHPQQLLGRIHAARATSRSGVGFARHPRSVRSLMKTHSLPVRYSCALVEPRLCQGAAAGLQPDVEMSSAGSLEAQLEEAVGADMLARAGKHLVYSLLSAPYSEVDDFSAGGPAPAGGGSAVKATPLQPHLARLLLRQPVPARMPDANDTAESELPVPPQQTKRLAAGLSAAPTNDEGESAPFGVRRTVRCSPALEAEVQSLLTALEVHPELERLSKDSPIARQAAACRLGLLHAAFWARLASAGQELLALRVCGLQQELVGEVLSGLGRRLLKAAGAAPPALLWALSEELRVELTPSVLRRVRPLTASSLAELAITASPASEAAVLASAPPIDVQVVQAARFTVKAALTLEDAIVDAMAATAGGGAVLGDLEASFGSSESKTQGGGTATSGQLPHRDAATELLVGGGLVPRFSHGQGCLQPRLRYSQLLPELPFTTGGASGGGSSSSTSRPPGDRAAAENGVQTPTLSRGSLSELLLKAEMAAGKPPFDVRDGVADEANLPLPTNQKKDNNSSSGEDLGKAAVELGDSPIKAEERPPDGTRAASGKSGVGPASGLRQALAASSASSEVCRIATAIAEALQLSQQVQDASFPEHRAQRVRDHLRCAQWLLLSFCRQKACEKPGLEKLKPFSTGEAAQSTGQYTANGLPVREGEKPGKPADPDDHSNASAVDKVASGGTLPEVVLSVVDGFLQAAMTLLVELDPDVVLPDLVAALLLLKGYVSEKRSLVDAAYTEYLQALAVLDEAWDDPRKRGGRGHPMALLLTWKLGLISYCRGDAKSIDKFADYFRSLVLSYGAGERSCPFVWGPPSNLPKNAGDTDGPGSVLAGVHAVVATSSRLLSFESVLGIREAGPMDEKEVGRLLWVNEAGLWASGELWRWWWHHDILSTAREGGILPRSRLGAIDSSSGSSSDSGLSSLGALFGGKPQMPPRLQQRQLLTPEGNVAGDMQEVRRGTVFALGCNQHGQLGVGRPTTMPSWASEIAAQANGGGQPAPTLEAGSDLWWSGRPIRVMALKESRVKDIACGESHCVAVDVDGQLYAWGGDEFGQASGVPGRQAVYLPTQVLRSMAIRSVHFVGVACGAQFSVALDRNGDVWAWGNGEGGVLGLGPAGLDPTAKRSGPARIEALHAVAHCTAISCGSYHATALLGDGQLYTWGRAEGGQLGISEARLQEHWEEQQLTDTCACEPMRVLFPGGLAKTEDQANGVNDSKAEFEKEAAFDLVRLTQVGCGDVHSCALDTQGQVWSWGWGEFGQLGLGFSSATYEAGTGGVSSRRPTPEPIHSKHFGNAVVRSIACGGAFSAAVCDAPPNGEAGNLFLWGANEVGQCAHPPKKPHEVTVPTKVRSLMHTVIRSVACGAAHALAIDSGGRVYSWGASQYGQLGTANPPKIWTPPPACEREADPGTLAQHQPVLIQSVMRLNSMKVACGLQHSLIVTEVLSESAPKVIPNGIVAVPLHKDQATLAMPLPPDANGTLLSRGQPTIAPPTLSSLGDEAGAAAQALGSLGHAAGSAMSSTALAAAAVASEDSADGGSQQLQPAGSIA